MIPIKNVDTMLRTVTPGFKTCKRAKMSEFTITARVVECFLVIEVIKYPRNITSSPIDWIKNAIKNRTIEMILLAFNTLLKPLNFKMPVNTHIPIIKKMRIIPTKNPNKYFLTIPFLVKPRLFIVPFSIGTLVIIAPTVYKEYVNNIKIAIQTGSSFFIFEYSSIALSKSELKI